MNLIPYAYIRPTFHYLRMASVKIPLHPTFRGFVAGVVNASYKQRAFFEVLASDGRQVAAATFEGQGVRVHLKNVINNREHWSFGPFDFAATLHIVITHDRGNGFVPSKMVGPLAITKQPEPDYPMEFHKSTVISEDGADSSHDDCTFLVLEYKGRAISSRVLRHSVPIGFLMCGFDARVCTSSQFFRTAYLVL